MMTKEQFLKRKARRRRRKMIMRLSLVVAGLVFAVVLLWYIARGIVRHVKSAFTSSEAQGETLTPDQFDTPTPTPTYVPVEGLIRRDPKTNCKLVLRIKSDYENNEEVNVRINPLAQSTLLGKVKVGDRFTVSCAYTDPEHKGFTGFLGSEVGIDGHIVWIYDLYCDLDDVMEPWAVQTIDAKYVKKYGKSRVTIRQYDGNSGANVRSEPWESQNSSYGKVRINATFVSDTVYVSSDMQWYGFTSTALSDYVENTERDPDGIVWIYANYCIIAPQ